LKLLQGIYFARLIVPHEHCRSKQLALDRPDRVKLRRLTIEIVAEEARLKKLKYERIVRVGYRLLYADGKALGRFMVPASSNDLRDPKPVLEALPTRC
jgi:hypothetical protein